MRSILIAVLMCGCAASDGSSQDTAVSVDMGATDGPLKPPAPPAPNEQAYTLRINADPAPLQLDMSRDEVEELLGPVGDDIVLLDLDSTPLLMNILREIKAACGEDWRNNKAEPVYDCDQTPLGRTFSQPWQESPEFSLIRLLTMTPANSIVDRTSIDFLQGVSDLFNIGGGFPQILSDSLDIGITEEFIGERELVASLRENLLVSHPNTVAGGRIRVTLNDALADLRTLKDKLGPVGTHPGVLDPSFEPHGQIFGPDFHMRVVANSNIRILDGLKMRTGIENISVLADFTGPTFNDPLEFDFSDPNNFELSGLVDEPQISMRFALSEHIDFVDACAGDEICRQNLPEHGVGNRSVWDLPRWKLEYITSYAAWLQYQTLRTQNCYVACAAAEVSVGQGDDPGGWMHFGIPFELGPQDQYAWELISEVAQVGLHPEHIPEGQANVAFTVEGVFAGISGAEAAETVRPYLQAQGPVIADFLLGNFRERSGAVDIYLQRFEDGSTALVFLASPDLANGVPYLHVKPGFFWDEALTEKASSLRLDAIEDTLHEKVRVTAGEQILYVQDDAMGVYRLRISPVDASLDAVQIYVSQVR